MLSDLILVFEAACDITVFQHSEQLPAVILRMPTPLVVVVAVAVSALVHVQGATHIHGLHNLIHSCTHSSSFPRPFQLVNHLLHRDCSGTCSPVRSFTAH